MSLSVSCGTPAQPVTPPRELPPQAADAGQTPDAPADAAPDAPRPLDAAVATPIPIDAPQVKHKSKVVGHVFRADPDGRAYHDVNLYLVNASDPTISRYGATSGSLKGAFELTDVPPGNYKLHIADNTNDGDGVMDVTVKKDQVVKLEIDLNRIALRRRPPKPYGAPPARRRVV